MTKSLEDLRKERNQLLRGSGAKESMESLSRQRNLERKKLNAEIRALKHPRSSVARRTAKKVGVRFGKFVVKRAGVVSANLADLDRQRRRKKAPVRAKSKKAIPIKRKPVAKSRTVKRRGRNSSTWE